LDTSRQGQPRHFATGSAAAIQGWGGGGLVSVRALVPFRKGFTVWLLSPLAGWKLVALLISCKGLPCRQLLHNGGYLRLSVPQVGCGPNGTVNGHVREFRAGPVCSVVQKDRMVRDRIPALSSITSVRSAGNRAGEWTYVRPFRPRLTRPGTPDRRVLGPSQPGPAGGLLLAAALCYHTGAHRPRDGLAVPILLAAVSPRTPPVQAPGHVL
jgi:hypothetical protein